MMMFWIIIIPFLAGMVILLAPSRLKGVKEAVSLVAALIGFSLSITAFVKQPLAWSYAGFPLLHLDNLSGFILLAAGLFGVLIVLYSFRFMSGKPRLKEYYACLLFTLGSAFGALLSQNLICLLIFWGLLGITLYLLVGAAGPSAAPAAKKTFIIVGGSDALLVLGVVLVWSLTGNWQLGKILLPLRGGAAIAAFVCFLVAALAKVGAMPFHSWVPDAAEKSPVPVAAFLPASLDKLVGIYLLARICLDLFRPTAGAGAALMVIGAVTIVAAVMMALIQHDGKRLLGFHAVSQAGYMILGIGTGTPVGIAGGLFHMLNNAIYKQALFLTVGSVEHRRGTTDLDRLGGLAKAMPITFGAFLVAALAISGIPPLNGFVSKWMIYQGLIEMGERGGGWASRLWVVWLLAAMFGSALTLASFMKLLHAVFLGSGEKKGGGIREEVGWDLWLPGVVLAILCVALGIFAYGAVIKGFLEKAVPGLSSPGAWVGWWKPGLASVLILLGLFLGWVIYRLGTIKSMRENAPYIGGEDNLPPERRVTGTGFYNTIREMGLLKEVYAKAGRQCFDIYERGTELSFWLTDKLRSLHSGLLPQYLRWCMVGLIVLLIILLG